MKIRHMLLAAALSLLAVPAALAQSNGVTPGRLADDAVEGEFDVTDVGRFFSLVRHTAGTDTKKRSVAIKVCNPAGNDNVYFRFGASGPLDVTVVPRPDGTRSPRIEPDVCKEFRGAGAHSAALITATGETANAVEVTSLFVSKP